MDTRQAFQQKRNPNVQKALMPYFIMFFFSGIDFIHDSFKQIPVYLKLFLLAATVLGSLQRFTAVITVILALAKSTMDLGRASLLTCLLVSGLNSLVGHIVFYWKWPQVKKILMDLNDITTTIMNDDSTIHKKALWIQRFTIFFFMGGSITATIISMNQGMMPELDSWIFTNSSTSYFGNGSRPLYVNFIYATIQQSCLFSHFVFVGFFTVINFYIMTNFECLRQTCLKSIRELQESTQKSTSRLKRTVHKTIVWRTESPEHKTGRRLRGFQHPVWTLLRCHQALSQLIALMNTTFREVIAIWTFSELTILIFIIRAMNIGVALTDNYFEITGCITVFGAVFLSKSFLTGAINDQVSSLFLLLLRLFTDTR